MEHEHPESSPQDNSPSADEACLSPRVSRREFLRTAGMLDAGIAL